MPTGANFTQAITRFNGSDWRLIYYGTSNDVSALSVYRGQLIVGTNGWFREADGNVSAYFARWGIENPIIGDLNHDCTADWQDVNLFGSHWLETNCEPSGFCYESDLNYDTKVDLADFAVFAEDWLSNQ